MPQLTDNSKDLAWERLAQDPANWRVLADAAIDYVIILDVGGRVRYLNHLREGSLLTMKAFSVWIFSRSAEVLFCKSFRGSNVGIFAG